LDIDDTILDHNAGVDGGLAAPGAADFVRWLQRHFEVRWLTRWCPSGCLSDEQCETLAARLAMRSVELRRVRNTRAFVERITSYEKHHGIDFAEADAGRAFVWIEDALTEADRRELARRGYAEAHVPCNVTERPERLAEVRREIAIRFGLPAG
jgi:hypothetical protein